MSGLPPWIFPAYLVVFVGLDWASYIRPFHGINITPWNPQPALALVLLLLAPRGQWLVAIGLILAEIIVRGPPFSWAAILASALALTLSYSIMARALQLGFVQSPRLTTRSDIYWLSLVTAIGAAICGGLYISSQVIARQQLGGEWPEAIIRYWVGDFVGVIVAMPLLLIGVDPQQRSAVREAIKSRDWWIALMCIGTLIGIASLRKGESSVHYAYLLLLPVVWVSAQAGLAGAVLVATTVQISLIVSLKFALYADLAVFELQLLMGSIATAALIVGITADEQRRARGELRQTLRSAAAGQMTAALAHELGQPLTAIGNYARACRLILDQDSRVDRKLQTPLRETLDRMIAEVQRAGDVIHKLRDFFKSGTLTLQPMHARPIVEESVAALKMRAEELNVRLSYEQATELPLVLMDWVQIAIVLRNLIGNAIDAAASVPRGLVTIRSKAVDDQIQFSVIDNGRGVEPHRIGELFEPLASLKPAGMGLGLSICRVIIEAHGGRLWHEQGPSGVFHFTLPIGSETSLDSIDAS